jgi:hypothetical protein
VVEAGTDHELWPRATSTALIKLSAESRLGRPTSATGPITAGLGSRRLAVFSTAHP